MGNIVARVFSKQEFRILVQGLDAVGKTTMLYKLKLGEVVTTIPTIGFNVETIAYKDINFTAWDVGGRDKIRPLWRHYYKNTNALIFVVDSNDRERIEHARDELQQALSEDELAGVPVLIVANKQDLPNALSTAEVVEKMDLAGLRKTKWSIVGTSLTNKHGTGDLCSGLEWLRDALAGEKAKSSVFNGLKHLLGGAVLEKLAAAA